MTIPFSGPCKNGLFRHASVAGLIIFDLFLVFLYGSPRFMRLFPSAFFGRKAPDTERVSACGVKLNL